MSKYVLGPSIDELSNNELKRIFKGHELYSTENKVLINDFAELLGKSDLLSGKYYTYILKFNLNKINYNKVKKVLKGCKFFKESLNDFKFLCYVITEINSLDSLEDCELIDRSLICHELRCNEFISPDKYLHHKYYFIKDKYYFYKLRNSSGTSLDELSNEDIIRLLKKGKSAYLDRWNKLDFLDEGNRYNDFQLINEEYVNHVINNFGSIEIDYNNNIYLNRIRKVHKFSRFNFNDPCELSNFLVSSIEISNRELFKSINSFRKYIVGYGNNVELI